jgi:hypothetical protein
MRFAYCALELLGFASLTTNLRLRVAENQPAWRLTQVT